MFNLEKFDKRFYEWVYEEPQNSNKIGIRALIIAVSPLMIGGLLALMLIEIIQICDSL